MRTIETTVYQFSELDDAAKKKARAWFRRCQDGDNYFAVNVIEDSTQIAAMMGLDISKRSVRLMGGGTRQEPAVYWSGFSSQGDGACFEGDWRAAEVKPGAVAAHCPGASEQNREINHIAAEFERIAKEFPEASFSVQHRGHYSHENCTEFDFPFPDDGEEWPGERLEKWQGECDNLKETAKDFMRWIYRQLEKEYECQNADEQVNESITANEYEFTADGERA